MAEERDNFWRFERANRRKTVALVITFLLIYGLLGLGLDLLFHTFRIIDHQLIGFPFLTAAAVAIAAALALRASYRGSSVLMGAVGAHEIGAESAKTQMVADVVDEMALAAHIPRPPLYLMEDPAPNAFATGRDPAHAAIVVTQGLVDQMDREETQGVIAHEIAHIRGHDTRITQMATVMVGGFGLVSGSIWRSAEAQASGKIGRIPGFGFVALPLLVVSGIGWLFSKFAAIALSRQREYLADAAAVEFTRNPTALIRALEHIARIESPLKASLRGVAPLFIVDPFECGGASMGQFLDQVAQIGAQADKPKSQRDAEIAELMVKGMPEQNLFQGVLSSHPPIHDRIARLYGLLHEPSSAAPTLDQIDAKRSAAAKAVSEVAKTNPDAAAAVLESMLRMPAATQLMGALGANLPEGGADSAEPSGQAPVFDNPSEQAEYQRLYKQDLELADDASPLPIHPPRPGSPLEAIFGGQPPTIDHDKLRAAFALAMASAQKTRPAVASPKVANNPAEPPSALHYIFWIVIALSAGAIAAALAFK